MEPSHNSEVKSRDAKPRWKAPSMIVFPVEEITLGKLGSSFDGPGFPATFDG